MCVCVKYVSENVFSIGRYTFLGGKKIFQSETMVVIGSVGNMLETIRSGQVLNFILPFSLDYPL